MPETPNSDLSMYSDIYSVLGLPLGREFTESVGAVVIGLPYDLTTSGRPGAVASLRHASQKHLILDRLTDKALAGGAHLK